MTKNISFKKGYIIIFHTLLFVSIILVLLLGVINPVISNYSSARAAMSSKQAFLAGDSALEEAVYRLNNNKNLGASQTVGLSSGTSTIIVTTIPTGKQITVNASSTNYQKNLKIDMNLGDGIAFHYGIQSGMGGFSLSNSSSITGNVFSSGSIVGSGNTIRGEVISSGPNGLIDGIIATGTAYANTIRNSTIEKDAYYVTKTNTTVNGTSYPNSPDQTPADLPISDQQINTWETQAFAGGILLSSECDSYSSSSNTCTISTSKVLGPKKIPFNVLIKSSSGVLTVAGPLWITGNLTTQTGPTIRMDSALGSSNVAIIADNPADTTGSGLIDIGQSTVFQGSGSPNSFVFIISQNNSAETGGSNVAITMSQGASALVTYASHGLITLSQSVSVKEATGYKIALSQSANVTYDTGLPNVLFSAGPGGGYTQTNWTEF